MLAARQQLEHPPHLIVLKGLAQDGAVDDDRRVGRERDARPADRQADVVDSPGAFLHRQPPHVVLWRLPGTDALVDVDDDGLEAVPGRTQQLSAPWRRGGEDEAHRADDRTLKSEVGSLKLKMFRLQTSDFDASFHESR